MIRDGKMGGPIAEIYTELELEEREHFLDVAIGAVFVMPHGGCMHNFASRPCPVFLACLSGCSRYHRTIGSVKERTELKAQLSSLDASLAGVKQAIGAGDEGAFNFLKKMMRRREGIVAALAMDDELPPGDEGTVLQVFPNGKDLSKTDLSKMED